MPKQGNVPTAQVYVGARSNAVTPDLTPGHQCNGLTHRIKNKHSHGPMVCSEAKLNESNFKFVSEKRRSLLFRVAKVNV